jgi:hypothetical protein
MQNSSTPLRICACVLSRLLIIYDLRVCTVWIIIISRNELLVQ